MSLAKICIDSEEALYKAAEERGWRGFKPLTLTKKETIATDVVSFTFKTERVVSWSPGQYLTVRVNTSDSDWHPTATRHYTVTSPVGASELQCTTKRLDDKSRVTNYMHKLNVGDTVDVSIPFGASIVQKEKPHVLLSAGVGITSSVAAFRAIQPAQLVLAAHIDRNTDAHPFRTLMPGDKQFNTYTDISGRPNAASWVKDVVARAGEASKKDAAFRICGPPVWMKDVEKELNAAGVVDIKTEFFASKK